MRPLLALLLAMTAAAPAGAQGHPEGTAVPVLLPRLAGPIVLDGRSDEAAWQAVAPLPLTMNAPVFRGTLTERTEIRVAYDDGFLYAAGRFYDTDPAGIRGNGLTRDVAADTDDFFGLILDTFNDNETAVGFITTPAGIRIDQTVFDDAQFDGSSFPINTSWNTFWDVVTVRTDEGWFAEMRIPFSSLRFQDTDGRVVMGLMTWRWIGRKNEGHTFPEAPPQWMLSHIKPSIMHDVALEEVVARRPLYVTPYVLAGGGHTHALNDAETAYLRDTQAPLDVGLDLKYGLTSNLTLDLTLNTDFAQVEADDQQVNLTRFSLFFPEKRLFFQERSALFDVNTGGPTRLFYSRRIGLADDGPVPIYGGVRLVGRVGSWDLGLMDMQTAPAYGLPSENFGVLRVRRRVLNPNSYAGALWTSRLTDTGSYNLVYGLDALLRVVGDDYLTLNWAQTFDDATIRADSLTAFNTALLRAQWERRSNDGLGYSLGVKTSGERFDPGLGFALRTGATRLGGRLTHTSFPDSTSPVILRTFGVEASATTRHDDGTVETAEVGPFFFTTLRNGAFAVLNPSLQREDLREGFDLTDDVAVLPGAYTFFGATLFGQGPPRLLRLGGNLSAGTFYDGWRVSATLSPVWNVSPHLELGVDVALNRVRFPDRDAAFSADVVRLRARLALDTRLSANTFVQYNTLARRASTNFRVRYNFSEGHDLYVVYNEALNTHRLEAVPTTPRSDSRALLIKYAYTSSAKPGTPRPEGVAF